MKLSIKTQTLQDLVAKSMHGASNNKMLPITGLMAIDLSEGKLTLTTTDGTNYLYVIEDKVVGENFYVVVQAEMFSKLVARMTCETVILENTDSCLIVSGNGKYKIELPLDEEGEPIVFPDPVQSMPFERVETADIHNTTVQLILNTAKASLADNIEVPCYTGYYIGDGVVATDTFKICGIDINLWDTPALLSSELLDLVGLMTDENIEVVRGNSVITFSSDNMIVYGHLMDSIDDYQIGVIKTLLADEFTSKCKVSKNRLLQLLNRLSLFVSPYDKNAITLTFTNSGIQVDSKQSNSTELIEYMESENFAPFTCDINIEMLTSQVKACVADSVYIEYGKDNAIKLSEGNVTQVIALIV